MPKKKQKISLDLLARKMDAGFGLMNKKFKRVDKRFEGMEKKIEEKIVDMASIVQAGFEGMENRMDEKFAEIRNEMATKEDLKRFATKEDLAKAESRLDAKINVVKAAVDDVKVELSALSKRDKEDTDAVVHEMASVKQRLNVLEHVK